MLKDERQHSTQQIKPNRRQCDGHEPIAQAAVRRRSSSHNVANLRRRTAYDPENVHAQ
jgi:hypothetical protein